MKTTIKDIAKASGYGVGTVSRVLSNDKSVSDKTRQKILDVIKELDYIPNVNGARLKQKHSKVIAVLVPVIYHPFFAEFVEELEKVSMDNNYSLLLVTSQNNIDKEKEIINMIKSHRVDGAIFVTHYNHDENKLKGCPLVSIDRHLGNDIPLITSDNYDATMSALEKLFASGARKIAFIGSKPSVDSEVNLRYQAYVDFVKKHGLPTLDLFEVVGHGGEKEMVAQFFEKYKDFDAVFASGYSLSVAIYKELLNRKMAIPNDVQLVSYDGLFFGTEMLTAIQQPIKEMAIASFLTLTKLIKGEEVNKKQIINTTFIKGETTL